MIGTRRRKIVVSRGNLEDGSSQSRSQFGSNNSQSRNMVHNRHQNVQGSNNFCNNVISSVQTKNLQKTYSTEDTSSSESEDEEFFHSSRLGLLRHLNDYETGESSDRNCRRTRAMTKRNQQKPDPTTSQQILDSGSSSDDSLLSPKIVNHLKRPLSPTSSSDTSDSGVPIASRRSVKRMRVFSSSEESSSESSSNATYKRVRPDVRHELENNINNTEQVNPGESQIAGNSTQESGESPVVIPGPSAQSSRRRRMSVIESETESDLVSTNHTIRRRRIPVIESEDDTGSSMEHTGRSSRASSVQGVAQRISSVLLDGIHDIRRRRNALSPQERESGLVINVAVPVRRSVRIPDYRRRQVLGSNIMNSESDGQNVWRVTAQVEETEDNGVPISNSRRVTGRRIPVVETEDDSESDATNSNEIIIPDGGNAVVSRRGSDVINLRTRTVQSNNERNTMSNYNLRRRNNPLIQNEDELESDVSNSNEILIPDGGNAVVSRRGSDVINLRTRTVQSNNERNTISNYILRRRNNPLIQIEDESNSSDSDIRPRTLSNRMVPIFFSSSTSSSSSTDSDDSIPIRNPRRHTRPIPIVDDYEDIANNFSEFDVNIKDSTVENIFADHDGQNRNSSDTDGESEKCPICLVGFKLQEIGKPKSCDHKFCSPCIKEWATKNNTCPVDRKTFDGIVVYDQFEGKIIDELPVEKPNPMNDHDTDFGRLEEIVAELFTDSSDGSSWYFDSGGDGPEEMCFVCGTSNQPHRMISCDSCDTVYHLGCATPPLRDFPSNNWYCSECVFRNDSLADSDESDESDDL